METVKKHKVMVIGLLAALLLGIVGLIAFADSKAVIEESASVQGVLGACPAAACVDKCPCPAKEAGACPTECPVSSCTAKNAEEKAASCPFMRPKSCCPNH